MLKGLETGFIDLCYIDPPFFSRRNHKDVSKSTSEVRGFQDTWTGDITNYINFIKPRISEIYRVLKPNGTLYLQCDVSAVFHLKVACDEIFSYDNFLNCIVWKRHSPSKNTDRNYGSIADYILIYVKGPKYTFNVQYLPIDQKVFNMVEPVTGRKFRSQPLVVKGNQEGRVFDFGGRKYTIKKGKALKWTQETINKRLAKNPRLIYWTSGGEPRYKTYLDEHKGIKLSCLWTDIQLITSTSSERLGYPTQKPRKLIERIIKVSSNPGDVVLDAFNGSGTTTFCAKNLNRKFIGIDRSATACRLAASRISYPVRDIVGHPVSKEELSTIEDFEFVNWIAWKMNATQNHDYRKEGIDAICRGTGVPVIMKQSAELKRDEFHELASILEARVGDTNTGAIVVLDRTGEMSKFGNELPGKTGVVIKIYTIDDLNGNVHVSDNVSISPRAPLRIS
ncbi:MAG: DNA methyltransferase [Promethearchaeota archaeon]